VGDVRPLHAEQVVDQAHPPVVAIVPPEEVSVELGQGVCGQGLALLRRPVDGQLEVRELGLPEDRALEPVEVAHEQGEPRVVVLDRLEHPVDQQGLVEGGGHLRHEGRVVGGGIGLGLVGVEAVQGVAQLVGQGTDVAELAVEVEQDVGVHVVAAAVGVGP